MLFHKPQGGIIAVVSLIIAMGLRILPLSDGLAIFNPDWVALVIIYWCLAMPERFGVGWAWITGLFTDILTGRLLGQNALCYCIIAFIGVRFHRRLRPFPLSQQVPIVFVLLLLGQLIIFWTQNIQGTTDSVWRYGASAISGAMVWPLVFIVMRRPGQGSPV